MKQYLMMVDEVKMALIGNVLQGIQFIEVEGMNMEGQDYMALVVKKPKPEEAVTAIPVQDVPGNEHA